MSKSEFEAPSERRIVLFLDFLRFKEITRATESDPQMLSRVIEAIETLRSIGRQQEFFKTQQVTQFSDCVVVSYRCDERCAVFDLISELGFALTRLVELGFLVRGAVTVGNLIHTDRYLLGAAMVEAYELESKCAIYPRVLVSNSVLDVAHAAPAEHHDGEDECAYVEGYLSTDTDGCRYLEYVSWKAVIEVIGGDNDMYGSYLGSVAKILKKGIAAKAPDVRLKYEWLRQKYVRAIDAIAALPPDHAWVRANSEMHEAIIDLPRRF